MSYQHLYYQYHASITWDRDSCILVSAIRIQNIDINLTRFAA